MRPARQKVAGFARRHCPTPHWARQQADVLEFWKLIEAPELWVQGDRSDGDRFWGHRYPRADFDARLAVVRHDQPEALAARVEAFLDRP